MDRQAEEGKQEPQQFAVVVPGLVHTYTTAYSNAQALTYALQQAFTSRNEFLWNGKRYEGEIGLKTLIADLLNDPGFFDYVQPMPGMPSKPVEIPLPTVPVNQQTPPPVQPNPIPGAGTPNPAAGQAQAKADALDAIVRKAIEDRIKEHQVDQVLKEAALVLHLDNEDLDALANSLHKAARAHPQSMSKEAQKRELSKVANRHLWKRASILRFHKLASGVKEAADAPHVEDAAQKRKALCDHPQDQWALDAGMPWCRKCKCYIDDVVSLDQLKAKFPAEYHEAAAVPSGQEDLDHRMLPHEYASTQQRWTSQGGALCEMCGKPTDGGAFCSRHEQVGLEDRARSYHEVKEAAGTCPHDCGHALSAHKRTPHAEDQGNGDLWCSECSCTIEGSKSKRERLAAHNPLDNFKRECDHAEKPGGWCGRCEGRAPKKSRLDKLRERRSPKAESAFCPNCDHEKNEHDTNGKCTHCGCLSCDTKRATAGTWALPFDLGRAEALASLLEQYEGLSEVETSAFTSALYNLYGDDALFDELEGKPEDSGRFLVIVVASHLEKMLAQYAQAPQDFRTKPDPEALSILQQLAAQYGSSGHTAKRASQPSPCWCPQCRQPMAWPDCPDCGKEWADLQPWPGSGQPCPDCGNLLPIPDCPDCGTVLVPMGQRTVAGIMEDLDAASESGDKLCPKCGKPMVCIPGDEGEPELGAWFCSKRFGGCGDYNEPVTSGMEGHAALKVSAQGDLLCPACETTIWTEVDENEHKTSAIPVTCPECQHNGPENQFLLREPVMASQGALGPDESDPEDLVSDLCARPVEGDDGGDDMPVPPEQTTVQEMAEFIKGVAQKWKAAQNFPKQAAKMDKDLVCPKCKTKVGVTNTDEDVHSMSNARIMCPSCFYKGPESSFGMEPKTHSPSLEECPACKGAMILIDGGKEFRSKDAEQGNADPYETYKCMSCLRTYMGNDFDFEEVE